MRVAFFLTTLFAASISAIASMSSVISLDHHQTFAYGEMVWHQLYLERTGGELAARITFSNLPYASDDEPRRDESFDFRFPGIKFDATRRTFFVSGRAAVTRSQWHGFAAIRFAVGLIWHPVLKYICLRKAGA